MATEDGTEEQHLKPTERRLQFYTDLEEYNWIRREANQQGVSVGIFLASVLINYRQQLEEEQKEIAQTRKLQAESDAANLTPEAKQQAAFLEKVRTTNSMSRAARYAGVNMETVDTWRKGDDFRRELVAASVFWVDSIQDKLLLVGTGKLKKGDPTALKALLAAHHPAYGRPKVEMLMRIINPIIARYNQILREELGSNNEAGLKKARDRLTSTVKKRFSSLT